MPTFRCDACRSPRSRGPWASPNRDPVGSPLATVVTPWKWKPLLDRAVCWIGDGANDGPWAFARAEYTVGRSFPRWLRRTANRPVDRRRMGRIGAPRRTGGAFPKARGPRPGRSDATRRFRRWQPPLAPRHDRSAGWSRPRRPVAHPQSPVAPSMQSKVTEAALSGTIEGPDRCPLPDVHGG